MMDCVLQVAESSWHADAACKTGHADPACGRGTRRHTSWHADGGTHEGLRSLGGGVIVACGRGMQDAARGPGMRTRHANAP